jgi:hypothetical protein
MPARRLALVALIIGFVLGRSAAAGDGAPAKPVRTDGARVRQLVQIVQAEPDEQKRRAAVLELGRADPRHSADVIPALSQALLKDPSAAVRLTAVEVIGGFRIVFTMAGSALETALDSDASAVVRGAAKQALWDYHLMGYRTARSSERLLAQTEEPPRAKPARPAPPVTGDPVRAAVAQFAPPAVPLLPTVAPLPAVPPLPGPRVVAPPASPVAAIRASWPITYQTPEPPLARLPGHLVSTARTPAVAEPPVVPPPPQPLPTAVATPPPPGLHLPPLVPDLGRPAPEGKR